MTRLISLTMAIILTSGPGLCLAEELTPRQIYERMSPAVVMIMGYSNSGQRGTGGTGSIIQQDGLVLTNAHVVIDEPTGKPFSRLTVYLKPDQVTGESKHDLSRSGKARVLAWSQPLDLALLKIEGMPGPFPVLGLDDSDHIQIGDRVVAIGHPEQGGLWTLTTGTISSQFDNFNATQGKSVFQTETGLNRGNSGGPLLDTEGRMIGVNTAIARVAADGMPITSISFSLKSNVAKRWLGEQGLGSQEVRAPSGPPSSGLAGRLGTIPSAQLTQPSIKPAIPKSPALTSPALPLTQIAPSKPYNLDRLVNERSRAEADLEDMIKEMRGRFSGR